MPAFDEIKPPGIGVQIRLASYVIFLSFGLFFIWAIYSPLESAAIAVGKLSSEGKQKSIEHLEGGLIESIQIVEGQFVRAGDVLISLDKTQAKATLSILEMRQFAEIALLDRLEAEKKQEQVITFSNNLVSTQNSDVKEILESQRRIFEEKRTVLSEKEAMLNKQVAQYEAEKSGLTSEIHYLNKRIAITQEDIDSYLMLKKKGITEGKIRLNALRRQLAELMGERSKNRAAISRSEQKISETHLRKKALRADADSEVVQELREVQSILFDLEEKVLAAKDILQRTDIRAPVSGLVVGLQVHTVGSVVSPGEALMGIVPDQKELVVEARISPMDIDIVRVGLPANVRLTSLSSRNFHPIEGEVTKVSADRFVDERTADAYYEAEVKITGDLSEWEAGQFLYPGMPAEVMILTGKRTPIEYLLDPLSASFNRAFKES